MQDNAIHNKHDQRPHDALLDGLAGALPAGSVHNHPHGGMFVWARLPEGWDATTLLPRALKHDVAYVPRAPFFSAEPDRATVRLSFSAHSPEEIHHRLTRPKTAHAPVPSPGGSVPRPPSSVGTEERSPLNHVNRC